ncbi:flagellar attachment zone protein 1-like protein [Lasius niger]|uniref:Flagellar attachment zone protein 1-like protein n=1 Tax=Lasius niger TaxID=67767 RepID=A0A0J7KTM4_LASNI|nr:flagellar attachment zone protein 1-like protein [Lasius niger]
MCGEKEKEEREDDERSKESKDGGRSVGDSEKRKEKMEKSERGNKNREMEEVFHGFVGGSRRKGGERKKRMEGRTGGKETRVGRGEEDNRKTGTLKDGKAIGQDGIPNEVWKYGGEEIKRQLGKKGGKMTAVFIDLKAAFDTVDREVVVKAMRERRVRKGLVVRVEKMLTETKSRVRVGEDRSFGRLEEILSKNSLLYLKLLLKLPQANIVLDLVDLVDFRVPRRVFLLYPELLLQVTERLVFPDLIDYKISDDCNNFFL